MSRGLIDVSLIAIYTLVDILIIYSVWIVNAKHANVKSFRVELNAILIFNFIQTADIIASYTLIYIGETWWGPTFSILFVLSGVICNIQLFLIAKTDIQILKVFSILDENITEDKLKILKRVTVALFLLGFISSIFPLVSVDGTLNAISDLFLSLFAAFVVIYDNIQSFYLVRLIYSYKKQKLKQGVKFCKNDDFAKVQNMILIVLGFDWVSLTAYVLSVVVVDEYSYQIASLSILGVCLHSLAMIFILQKLAKLSVSQKQKPLKDRDATQREKNTMLLSQK
ncbi:hypothetical protein HDV06_006777 [Boothiomyces sp. JEL0866]|nr:hypothetical protein HDV06_006777 [Boothiomyces sp. JEL0866]